jgi:uncharacterized LabA/DUF88 family protein
MISNVTHREQKVGVLVDVQNLYYSAKHLYSAKVNFKEVLNSAVLGRRLTRAFAYVIRADMKEEEPFYHALSQIGFEVKAKDLQVFFSGSKKGDWDVGIAMDAIQLANKVDVVVLVSGDGDYVPLVEHLQHLGCKVEMVAFGTSSSSKLKEAVDGFTDLDLDKKYLITKYKAGGPRTPPRKELPKGEERTTMQNKPTVSAEGMDSEPTLADLDEVPKKEVKETKKAPAKKTAAKKTAAKNTAKKK